MNQPIQLPKKANTSYTEKPRNLSQVNFVAQVKGKS
jgi:hypothetical protein